MRTSFVTVTGALALTLLTGCTTNEVEPPSLAGPSTLAKAITMSANKDTLFQNGVDFVDILVTSTSPAGQPQTVALRADIFVGGVAQDFGTLSTKNPTTPTTLRYTAPNASPLAGGQVSQVITIAVTPVDSGDFRSEVARQLDLRLVPQGVILPTNPNLTAVFTMAPQAPQAFSTVSFNASASTNGGVACNTACSFAWNFGDGTTGTGMSTTHEYRTVGTFQVTLTLTDSRGAQATSVQTISVTAPTPPTAAFVMSPTPVGINQDVFFNAEQSRAVLPRTIVNYGWNFGDGRTASGVTVSRSFSTIGSYNIVLSVTDDAGSVTQATQTLPVITAGAGPTAVLTFSPSTPSTATSVVFNGSGSTPGTAPISSYSFSYGDGTPDDVGTVSSQTHVFATAGSYVVRLTVTDTLGRTGTTTATVVIGGPATGAPLPVLTFSPAAPKAGSPVFFNASGSTSSAPIASYRFSYGDGTPDDVGPSSAQSHTFALVGGISTNYVVRVTVTDTLGRTGTNTVTVTVIP